MPHAAHPANSPDLFDAELAAAERAILAQQGTHQNDLRAQAIVRRTSRIETRRAKSEAVLADILPPIAMGTSYHVISHGDVDALSYLAHILRQTPVETLLISTWCMAMPDVAWLADRLHSGRIGHIDFVIGEIFPAQYPDEYLAVQALAEAGHASLRIARNHAKVMVGDSPDGDLYFAIESSANVNTNPRIEQTAIHADKALHDHYRQFFADIRSIDRATRQTAKP